ncbi:MULTISPECIES: cardiolipin synthase [Bacillus]|uniref:cardiolipin synthase n=1 Tax=Bacillus TaxID=1386 RepID=UPI000CD5C759|nr:MULTISPECIES: cardiolipin synthase [Bacillus]MBT0955391.1 cardiolipin synthase [Bacillus velezensis]MCQ9193608.1 cardiolipin synthase [Bacillus velezensis]MCX2916480.1 cardiolipin synthase [Bacillus velezensis]MCY6275374.1 cardiolipin synthase [Bacillus sp. NEAU-16]MDA3608006.1 cardiolipin synthase [Bacillus sp. NEAU-242-2]
MLKRRLEFCFLYMMLIGAYVIWFFPVSRLEFYGGLLCYASIILFSIYSLILENRTSQHTLLWIHILVFFPIAGYLFYLFSGQLYEKGKLFRSKRTYNREKLRTIFDMEQTPDLSGLKGNQKRFFQYSIKASHMNINTKSRLKVLKNGDETFPELFEALRSAASFIHIEYYMFKSDMLGHKMMEIMMEKARQGVEVRFLFDAAGSLKLAGKDIKKLKRAGVNIVPFLPLKYGFFNQKFNFRNHRKIVIVDGKTGFVGGLNVGKEYIGKDQSVGFWRDTHMKVEGEIVQTLHSIFMLDWEYVSDEVLIDQKAYSCPVPAESGGVYQVVPTGPDMKERMSDLYYAMIAAAESSVWIATPYFVPNEPIRTALKEAAARGVRVRVMVPETNDGFLTQYATRSYFPELLREGIEVYSYQKGFMHQKVLITDGNLASVGTANMDMRSFQLNFEVNVFFTDQKAIKDLEAHYLEDMRESEKISPVRFYKRTLWERTKESFARLFSGVL